MASIVSKLLGLGAGYGRQAISRVLPASEERILGNLERKAQEMLQRAAQKDTGFTFDPRRGKFLEPGKQSGSMMASVPNLPGQSSGAGTVQSVDELIATAKRPEVMSRLQRGEYLGGWNPEGGGVGLDPSRRFLTEFGALRSGLKTDQMGGFSLLRQRGYDVTPGELSSARNRLVAGTVGALAAGTAGALAVPGRNPVKDFIEGLKGNKEQSDAATFSGRLAREALLAGAIVPGVGKTAKAIRSGKKSFTEALTGGETPIISQAAREAVSGNEPASIIKAMEATSSPLFGSTNLSLVKGSSPILNSILRKSDLTGKSPSPADVETMISPFIQAETLAGVGKGTRDIIIPTSGYKLNPEFIGTNIRPVRNIDPINPDRSLLLLLKQGKHKEYFEAIADMVSNLLAQTPKEMVAAAKQREGFPMFYGGRAAMSDAFSDVTGLPSYATTTAKSAASAVAGPAIEDSRAIALLPFFVINKTGRTVFNLAEAEKVLGPTAMKGPGMKAAAASLEQVLNDPNFMGVNLPGISAKTHPYNVLGLDPKNTIASVEDTIQSGARTGVTSTMPSSFDQSIHGQMATRIAAKILGINPAAMQEMPWFVKRIIGQESSSSLASYPYGPSTLSDMLLGRIQVPAHTGGSILQQKRADDLAKQSKLLSDYLASVGRKDQLVDPEVVAKSQELTKGFISSNPDESLYQVVDGNLLPANTANAAIDFVNRTPENVNRLQMLTDLLKLK